MMPEYIYRPPQRPHSFGPTPLASSHYRDRAELSESRFGGGGVVVADVKLSERHPYHWV